MAFLTARLGPELAPLALADVWPAGAPLGWLFLGRLWMVARRLPSPWRWSGWPLSRGERRAMSCQSPPPNARTTKKYLKHPLENRVISQRARGGVTLASLSKCKRGDFSTVPPLIYLRVRSCVWEEAGCEGEVRNYSRWSRFLMYRDLSNQSDSIVLLKTCKSSRSVHRNIRSKMTEWEKCSRYILQYFSKLRKQHLFADFKCKSISPVWCYWILVCCCVSLQ